MGIVKNAEGEKVGKKSKEVENNYVNNTKILPHFFIQKRSVEKVVENVEKSIPPKKKSPNGRGKPSTKMPFFQEKRVFRSCNNYVLRKRKL